MALLDLLGRRWALRIIWELTHTPGPTFRELQQRCDGISSSVLTQRLAELGQAGIVQRAERGYTLTPDGQELSRDLMRLERWANRWQPPIPSPQASPSSTPPHLPRPE
ncbi:winged helix-turn-helix transcriptional regulator [Actinomadura sp. 21ATH]|uniref:winged helix-turn-helix transcriptional regulator n=1 Tax=Actinomadura sp. 21ATH TaxID=1735444 RepID=UPI0035C0B115